MMSIPGDKVQLINPTLLQSLLSATGGVNLTNLIEQRGKLYGGGGACLSATSCNQIQGCNRQEKIVN